jgi:type IV secretory pathway VirB2 component (pilin)
MKRFTEFRQRTARAFMFAVMAVECPSVFAAGGDIVPAGMTSLMDSILGVFTGPLVKTILIICLAGCAVAYGFNKDNEKMKRNIIAIAIAIGVVVGASGIVGTIWDASKG